MCATATTDATDLPEWLSVRQFAKAVGIGKTLAGELVRSGLVRGHEHGIGERPVWKIHRREVPRYLDATLIRPTDTDTDTDTPGSAA